MSDRKEIPQEKAWEYRQVAGIVCLDLDALETILDDADMTKERVVAQIKRLIRKKNELIEKPAVRQERWDAIQALVDMGAFGGLPDDYDGPRIVSEAFPSE